MATFDFTEEVTALGDFLTSADFYLPVSLLTSPSVNPVNLVTTLAHTAGRSLVVLRTDPTYQAVKYNTQVFNLKLSDKINSQLQDYATVRQAEASAVDSTDLKEFSNLPLSDSETIGK